MRGQKRELILAVVMLLILFAILIFILLSLRGFNISIFPV